MPKKSGMLILWFKSSLAVPCPSYIQLPMRLLYKKILTNEAMKPSRLKDHLTKLHVDKVDKPIAFFQA